MISEAPETQLKEVLGLVWPITDNINAAVGPVGHFEPSSAARICFQYFNSNDKWKLKDVST